jgi:hypothetical protein
MRKAKKTISAIFLAALMAILLVAMTACGASGTLSGFVSAVKNMDTEKAATYVDGTWSTSSSDADEVTKYAYKKTVGSFTYKVVSTEETKDDNGEVTATTIKISYSAYSYSALMIKMGLNTSLGDLFSGTQKTKDDVDTAIKSMEKVNGSTTVKITKNSDGAWKLSSAQATALVAVMSTPVSD